MKKFLLLLTIILPAALSAQPLLREDNIDAVVKAMTVEEKAALLAGTGDVSKVPGAGGGTPAIARLGIPGTLFADGPAGVRLEAIRDDVTDRTFYTTAWPTGVLMASSWDVALMEKMTAAMGKELLEYGLDLLLAPGMNIHRNPLCGRNFEYFSEDPLLSGRMASAYVKGIQRNGVGACLKHYTGNNQETLRDQNDARIGERALREIYLRNFEIAVKESRPWSVMSSYNKVNGEFTQQSTKLLTDILRDEWGFDGIVMTDWGNKDGTVKSAIAGNELMMPGSEEEVGRLIAAAKDGSLPMEVMDRNVRRFLEMVVKTPTFKQYPYSDQPDLQAHAGLAREAAAESIVLLKNEGGALPLQPGKKVALYGAGAFNFVAGGYGSGHVIKAYDLTLEEAMRQAGYIPDPVLSEYYNAYVKMSLALPKMAPGYDWWQGWLFGWWEKVPEAPLPLHGIPAQARENDYAVLVISRSAGEGTDRPVKDDFELSAFEREMLRKVCDEYHARGKQVVVVLNVGGVLETASWKHLPDAIVLPWQAGQEGANAVADVLSGKVTPSGKLPVTFPVDIMDHPSSANFPSCATAEGTEEGKRKNVDYTNYEEGIWVGYLHFDTHGVPVSYPFGYGLSYTGFSYSKPVVKAVAGGCKASVTVTNTGSAAGKEAVQVYVSAPSGGLEKPARELKAFGKTRLLQPGESQTLQFEIPSWLLTSYNEAAASWELARGTYKVQFGASIQDIRCEASF